MFFATIFLSYALSVITSELLATTHIGYRRLDRSIKKRHRLTRMPLPEPLTKILSDDVPSNTSKRHGALSPLLEAEVELVVLHPCNTRDIFLHAVSLHLDILFARFLCTALACPPRWFATAFAIEGFSATHNTRVMPAGRHGALEER
jgi:hypothetical protein